MGHRHPLPNVEQAINKVLEESGTDSRTHTSDAIVAALIEDVSALRTDIFIGPSRSDHAGLDSVSHEQVDDLVHATAYQRRQKNMANDEAHLENPVLLLRR